MIRKSLSIVPVLLLLAAISAPYTQADTFTISFANTIGNVSGTVTVLITGLTNNTTGPALSVTLLSYPSALDPQVAAAGTNVLSWGFQNSNVFTETAGVLVGEDFNASATADNTVEALVLDTITPEKNPLNPSPIDFLGYGPLNSTINTFTKAVETVPSGAAQTPEPTALSLIIIAIGLIVVRRIIQQAA